MKFSIIHKTFSVALSFLVLFSTLSLTIEKHFCGGTLVDVAVFTTTEKCADERPEINDSVITKKSCCKDEIDIIEGLELTVNSFEDLDDLLHHVPFIVTYTYTNFFEALPGRIIPHKDYAPPKLVEDLHLLNETYLI